MSSGYSGGAPEFYTSSGITGRSTGINHPQASYRSPLAGIIPDRSSQIIQRREFIGKRTLNEFQNLQQQHLYQQQQQALGLYLRNVRARNYQNSSPISPLSHVDFAVSISPETIPTSISSSVSSTAMSTRYGLPNLQQARQQPINFCNGNGIIPSSNPNFPSVSYPNLVQNRVFSHEPSGQESENKMMNRLQELEKQLLDDNDDEGDAVSVITNSEWSETIQNLISTSQNSISPSPYFVIVFLLVHIGFSASTSEQRWTAYMASALRSRVNPTEYRPPVAELYDQEHMGSTQTLYEKSPCFKLGFMAANLAILEATSDQRLNKLHVVDFDIGQGYQYLHLIHALAARKAERSTVLKITTFADFRNGSEERLKAVGDLLEPVASKFGVGFNYRVLSLNICDLTLETLGVENDEALAVNLAFRLYNLPDESVTTENLRDELLRRVKGLSPKVVTVVEQEMNANTAPFAARVTELCEYYGALFDSLDATMPKDNSDRVRIEQGLGRKAANSVSCEGRDRVERCEVFGKWRARMGMAGFTPSPLSQRVADSLLSKLNSETRGNPGFTVKEEMGRICFGWNGRTLTVASAWR
ncbi:hypothetical protein F0562_031206 [Nyssa sinensis]|uniref:Uncharacterized protein n=1 Tax=Nyssa sinensis TaxID=561372 RepID=A0A5J5ATK4_9ASTE|nr:hypothetical protein F0562_031206 [Nyssa sinensis]